MSPLSEKSPDTDLTAADREPQWRHLASGLGPYVATSLACLLFLFYFLDLWRADFAVPFDVPSGDYLSTALAVKTAMTTGWYTSNPAVGVPDVFEYHDYPMAEGLNVLCVWLIGLCGFSVIKTINLYYVMGYALVACSSLFLFRWLKLPAVPSMGASLLLAFLPAHYVPGEKHLFLGSYYMLPLMCVVLLSTARGDELVVRRPGGALRFTRQGWFAVAVAALIGSGGIYYAFFSGMFVIVAGCFGLRRKREFRAFAGPLVILATIFTLLVLNVAPSLIYKYRHGQNPVVGRRLVMESHYYGLKITQLILPVYNHRIPPLARMKDAYNAEMTGWVPNSDIYTGLGVLLSIGFLLLIGYAVVGMSNSNPVLAPLSAFNLTATLVGSIGGIGGMFAVMVAPQIRAYFRISVFIAIFSAIALLWLLARLEETCRRLGIPAAGIAVLCAAIMFAGLLDITPATWRDAEASRKLFESDRGYFRQVEAALPAGAMVFQLPYHPFPEAGYTVKMQDYEHLRGYIHSDRLRWSYPTINGRSGSVWQKEVAESVVPAMIGKLLDAGFKGVHIDLRGYADNGQAMAAAFRDLTGEQPLVDSDNRFAFFPLTHADAAKLTAAAGRLPLRLAVADLAGRTSGFHGAEGDAMWTMKRGAIAFRAGESINPNGSYAVSITGTLLSGRPVEVWLNSTRLGIINQEGYRARTTFEIAGKAFVASGDNSLILIVEKAGPAGLDVRELGYSFVQVDIAKAR